MYIEVDYFAEVYTHDFTKHSFLKHYYRWDFLKKYISEIKIMWLKRIKGKRLLERFSSNVLCRMVPILWDDYGHGVFG